MLAPRFVIRMIAHRASRARRASDALALRTVLTAVDDAIAGGLQSNGDLGTWHRELTRALKRRRLAALLGRDVPDCLTCGQIAQKRRRRGVTDRLRVCGVLLSGICRAKTELLGRLQKMTGTAPPSIEIEVLEEPLDLEPEFGLPFSASTECDRSRARIRFAFSKKWLDARVDDKAELPDDEIQAGFVYLVWHEMQHALDHALDRPRSFDGGPDHVFSEGWMDYAVAQLCSAEFRRDGLAVSPRQEALERIRAKRNQGLDAPTAEKAVLAKQRSMGNDSAAQFLALADAGRIPGGERAFWSFTMFLYAAPRILPHPIVRPYGHHWRARVIGAIVPALNDLARERLTPEASRLLQVVDRLCRARRMGMEEAVEGLVELVRSASSAAALR